MGIMEPYMNIEVSAPLEFEGAVTESLMDRQCQLENVDRENKWVVIKAYGPLDQMFGYITSLRSATQGKGEFQMEYREHIDVYPHRQEELIEEFFRQVFFHIFLYLLIYLLFSCERCLSSSLLP